MGKPVRVQVSPRAPRAALRATRACAVVSLRRAGKVGCPGGRAEVWEASLRRVRGTSSSAAEPVHGLGVDVAHDAAHDLTVSTDEHGRRQRADRAPLIERRIVRHRESGSARRDGRRSGEPRRVIHRRPRGRARPGRGRDSAAGSDRGGACSRGTACTTSPRSPRPWGARGTRTNAMACRPTLAR